MGLLGYRDGTKLKQHRITYVWTMGGLGDHLCRLAALKAVLAAAPHLVCKVYVYDYLLSFFKLFPHPRVTFLKMSERQHGPDDIVIDFAKANTSPLARHLVRQGLDVMVDQEIPLEECNYLKVPQGPISHNIPENFIVVTTGFTAPNREWKAEYVNRYVQLVKEKLELDVVFLGKKGNELVPDVNYYVDFGKVDYSKGLDLRDKTGLQEAAMIMSKSRCVVGLDNGLIHLAAMTDVPIVVGYTNALPKHRLPIRHGKLGWGCEWVTPYDNLECRGCMGKMTFVNHDFRTCLYDDYKCLDYITGERMFDATYRAIGRN